MDKQGQDDVFVRKWERQACSHWRMAPLAMACPGEEEVSASSPFLPDQELACSPKSAWAGLHTAQQAFTEKFYSVFHHYVSFFSQQIVNNIPMDVCNRIKSRKAASLLSLFVWSCQFYWNMPFIFRFFFHLKYTGVHLNQFYITLI